MKFILKPSERSGHSRCNHRRAEKNIAIPKYGETYVYNRYGRASIESRIMKGITLVDSMADRKNLIVVLLGFSLMFLLCRYIFFSNKLPATLVILVDSG